MRVADRDHAHPRCPRLEHVRAGAHDRPGRGPVVLALLFREALLDDDPRHRGELSFQPVVGLRQLDRHLGRAGRRDRGDPVQQARVVPAELGVGRAVQAVHHVGGGHRVAVPEFHPRPQREHQRGGRRVRDGGQAGLQRPVRRLAQQRLTHQGVGRVLRIARRENRVKRDHVPVSGPHHRGHRLGARRGDRGQARARRGVTRRGTARRGRRTAGGPGAGRDHHRACCYYGHYPRPAVSAVLASQGHRGTSGSCYRC